MSIPVLMMIIRFLFLNITNLLIILYNNKSENKRVNFVMLAIDMMQMSIES